MLQPLECRVRLRAEGDTSDCGGVEGWRGLGIKRCVHKERLCARALSGDVRVCAPMSCLSA